LAFPTDSRKTPACVAQGNASRLAALRAEIGELPPTAQKPVIVTDMDIRRFVRKLVEVEFPNVSVLSYQELSPDLTIQPIARIALPHGGRLAA
jgi:type III secretion protein V